jgi:hypothetical protein
MGRSALASSARAIAALVLASALAACSSADAPEEIPVEPATDAGDEVAPPPPPDVGAGPPPPVEAGTGCPPLTFPSGVTFSTKPDAELTAEYTSIVDEPNYPLPVCFIDTDDLVDPKTGATYDLDVKVGTYFTLRELVGTSLPYTKRVLLSPMLVDKLDRYRDALGESVHLTSGYRSPAHQRDVCQGICGADSCPGVCAERSRHSWGDAADHGVTPTKKYSDAGCAADFNYVYREGNHMHLDLNPQHAICTVDIL